MMNNRRLFGISIKLIIPAIALMILCAILISCKQGAGSGPNPISSSRLRVGIIDSDALIQDVPEIVSFFQEKEKETNRLRSLIQSGRTLSKKEQDEIAKKTAEYSQKELELIGKFVDTLREISVQVAEEQKLDIIINNKSSAQIIEFGGKNVTEDVRVKIVDSWKTDSTAGEASGTPGQPSPATTQ